MGSAGMAIVVLLFLLTLSLLVIAGIVLFVRGLGRRVREPECGSCGYGVSGINGLFCPECGADLRVAGIVVPGMLRKARGRHVQNVVAMTTVLVIVWFFGAAAVGMHPSIQQTKWIRRASVTPSTTMPVSLAIEAHGKGNLPGPASRVLVTAVLGADSREIELDLTGAKPSRWSGTGGSGTIGAELGLEELRTALTFPGQAAIAEEDLSDLRGYLRDAMVVGTAPPNAGRLAFTPGTVWSHTGPPLWWMLTTLGFAGLVWCGLAAGPIRAWRRERRELESTRLSRAGAGTPSAGERPPA